MDVIYLVGVMEAVIENKLIMSTVDIYWDVRRKLISTHYQAGQKLKPEEMRLEYRCSASSLREILFRLSCDGLVDFEEHKGFRVPQASLTLCNEAVEHRILIECEGARLSIENGNLEWEARFAAAHHKLAHVENKFRDQQNNMELFDIWCACEWEFHETLISKCGSSLLIKKHRDIYDLHRLHMLAVSKGSGFRDCNIEEHLAILQAALDRDAQACQQRIANHLHRSG